MKYYETMPSDIPLILSERTPVCVYSYARHIKDVPQYVLDFNDRFLKSTLKRKDLRFITIYFPTNIDFVADEVRLHSSRELIDETIRQILSEYNIEYYTMNETNLDTRVEIILTLIQQAVKEETPGSPIIYKRFLMGD
jgi:nicotinamide riboside kinase